MSLSLKNVNGRKHVFKSLIDPPTTCKQHYKNV